MANRKSKLDELATAEIDLTPMIDVVFNLIIFFMLVNQMVQVERAELELPIASEAREEKISDKDRLIINVHKTKDKKNMKIEIAGRVVSFAEFVGILRREASVTRDKSGVSNRAVLIRADIDSTYKSIQKVLVECARQKIYKISFGAKLSNE